MPGYNFPPQLNQLVQKQLDTGEYSSEDEVLLAALESLDAGASDWAAVKESLDTLEAGDNGVSLQEAFEEVRRRHGITVDA